MSYATNEQRRNRIVWRSLITGFGGRGQWQVGVDLGSTVRHLNRRYRRELEHWIERGSVPPGGARAGRRDHRKTTHGGRWQVPS